MSNISHRILNQKHLQISSQVYFKTSGTFREILRIPKVDICEVMKKPAQNFLVKDMIGTTNAILPGILHKCPYNVRCFLLNLLILI